MAVPAAPGAEPELIGRKPADEDAAIGMAQLIHVDNGTVVPVRLGVLSLVGSYFAASTSKAVIVVDNYDGLGGQIIFAWLHKNGVLHWTDNTLSLEWDRLNDSMVELCEQVEDLYRTGIDRSRLAHWISSYEFVASLVEPHPGSTWAKGTEHLPVTGELKEMVNLVMPDEFPLNVFYEALRKKLAPEIQATAGITA
mgnify:CR=1 FL=1